MNYETFLDNKDRIQGRNFTLHRFNRAESIDLNTSERFPVLFVLCGKVLLFSNSSEYRILAGEMALADQQQCRDTFCTQGTILLEYYLTKELSRRFETTVTEYCTPTIPVTGRLEEWVEELLAPKAGDQDAEVEVLIELLLKYQSRKLKSLCAPMKEYVEMLKWRRWKNNNPKIDKRNIR